MMSNPLHSERSASLKIDSYKNKYIRWVLILLVLMIFFSIYSLGSAAALHATALEEEQDELSSLWIDMSLGPPLLELFNQSAHSDDIARVEHISQLGLLRDVTTGHKLVVFKSADDAIRLLPHIHNEFDIIGYNLEHGPANPVREQEDPVGSIMRLREAAKEYGLEVALGPDHRFAESDAAAMAPYADYLILQIQKVQTEPDTVYDFVLPIIQDAREANSDLEVSVQIRTEGDVDELLEMLGPLQKDIDGISILTSEETVEVSESLMGKLRDRSNPPVEDNASTDAESDETGGITDILTQAANNSRTNVDDENTQIDNNAPLATVVAAVLEDPAAPDNILSAETSGNTLSTSENNQRTGSTWLFIIIALVVGTALGAGYISYRSGS